MAVTGTARGQEEAKVTPGSNPSLTLYSQNFAVVREGIRLNLGAGPTAVTYAGVTGLLEPDSVILRDPSGKRTLQVREQSFLSATATMARLLKKSEGKTLDFLVGSPQSGEARVVSAKVVRAGGGGVGSGGGGLNMPRFGETLVSYAGPDIVEVDGKIRFGLPGMPLFPREMTEGETLNPRLAWTLLSDRAGTVDAELAYLSGGFGWHADYNVVAPETGDVVDLIGWVTMTNASGRTFESARIKLLAGDIVKLQPRNLYAGGSGGFGGGFGGGMSLPSSVTEKSFDEYHLYTLQFPTTLRDQEMKQVEFARAEQVKAQRLYIYDGGKYDPNNRSDDWTRREYGEQQTNTKVWVMREFENEKKNGLGIPLPAGRVRFYRRDSADNSLEFVGENRIAHTPQGEGVRLYTGDAFDLVGERRQIDFKYDSNNREYVVEESFEIKVRNRKTGGEPIEVRIVEHLYRHGNWYLFAHSDPFTKRDATTVEFRVTVPPDKERTVTYTVRYTNWPVDEKGGRIMPPAPVPPSR